VPFLALVIAGLVGFGAMQLLDGRRLQRARVGPPR
jgi:hypothetical protein